MYHPMGRVLTVLELLQSVGIPVEGIHGRFGGYHPKAGYKLPPLIFRKWYLVGYCRLRRDYRTFRLDRMRKTQALEERFHRNEDFDFRAYAIEYLENYRARWRIRVVFEDEPARLRKRIPSSWGVLTRVPGAAGCPSQAG